jgi:hypothetical protein
MTTDSRYHFDSMSPREQTISTRSAILGGLRAAADIAAELTARLAEMRALAATERDTAGNFWTFDAFATLFAAIGTARDSAAEHGKLIDMTADVPGIIARAIAANPPNIDDARALIQHSEARARELGVSICPTTGEPLA